MASARPVITAGTTSFLFNVAEKSLRLSVLGGMRFILVDRRLNLFHFVIHWGGCMPISESVISEAVARYDREARPLYKACKQGPLTFVAALLSKIMQSELRFPHFTNKDCLRVFEGKTSPLLAQG